MKILCIGRNYADHARELKNQVPTEPVVFMKPDSAILLNRQAFFIPDFSTDVHYEAELVVKINRLGKHIEEKFAHRYYDEVGLGIDFTARDLQQKLKTAGLPWEKAKAFDGSAVVGRFTKLDSLEKDIQDLRFTLQKNGETVQSGHTASMLFGVNQLIAYLSRYFTLKIGDLIYTGTPAGVGPVQAGDILEGHLEGKKSFQVKIK